MRFVIQTVDGKCKLDLCQAMENAIEFDSWRSCRSIEEVVYCSIDDLDAIQLNPEYNYCPVGTLEFFFKYVDTMYGEGAHKKIKPLNVPKELELYALGNVYYSDTKELEEFFKDSENDGVRLFMKSMDTFKDEHNGFISKPEEVQPNTQLVVESPDLDDEWRVFIHNGKAIDIKKYSGNPFVFPDLDGSSFHRIISIATNQCGIKEGTVDIGMEIWCDDFDGKEYNRICVIECHDFFSCGLYGFNDNNAIPLMLWRTWLKVQREISK